MDWEHVKAVQRMQDYIVRHLDEDITLEQLSAVSGYSLWHSVRIFKAYTDKAPFEYIRALRLTKAARVLRDTQESVVNIAFDARFESHDGFTRAFYRHFQMTPKEYHHQKPPVSYFTYYPIWDYYRLITKKEEADMEKKSVSGTVMVQEVYRPQRKLIFLRSQNATDYLSYCEEMGCDWEGLLNSIAEKMDMAALIELPKSLVSPGLCCVAAGIEVPEEFDKPLPEGYEMAKLPEGSLLYFKGMPYENEEDFCEAIRIVMEAIENYRPEAYGYRFSDEAPRFNFGATGATGAKFAIPVTKQE